MSDVDRAEKRKNAALKIFADHPDAVSAAMREHVLAGQVVIGMSPYEAYLAGGAFAFRVVADPKRWPKNADPYKVMWGQSTAPDASEIWMTFENHTQYPAKGKTAFRVVFKAGRAARIEEHSAGEPQ